MAEPSSYPGAPRWVKVSGIVAMIVILLIVIVIVAGVGGPHGPGRHLSSTDQSVMSPRAELSNDDGV